MVMKLYYDRCSYWNASENVCAGSWSRAGGGVVCQPSGVYIAECPPGSAYSVAIPSGWTVRGEYYVSTTEPGTTPETVSGTYYGGVYRF